MIASNFVREQLAGLNNTISISRKDDQKINHAKEQQMFSSMSEKNEITVKSLLTTTEEFSSNTFYEYWD